MIYPIIKPPTNHDPSLNPVGMDVGTTRCCVGVNRIDGIEIVAIDNSSRLMPSFVSYEEELPKCGQIVCNRIKHHFKSTVFDIKRIIGKSLGSIVIDPSWPFEVIEVDEEVKIKTMGYGETEICLRSEEITSTMIKHMKKEVEAFQGQQPLLDAVITIPAAFNQIQINATIEAGILAGLDTVHILPEPIAACLTYASKQQIPDNSTVLLFDLGGGTLDVCIIRVNDQNLHILQSYGDQYLGGRDFDGVLMNHFLASLKEGYKIDLINDSDKTKLKRYKLMLLCQEIKHDLQNAESAWLDVSDIDPSFDTQIIIKREEFEKLSSGLLLRIKFKILAALNNLNMSSNEINYVLQVGGGCRMLMVKNLLQLIFPNAQHRCTVDPDWAVAYGATLYSYYLKINNDYNEVEDICNPTHPEDPESVPHVSQLEENPETHNEIPSEVVEEQPQPQQILQPEVPCENQTVVPSESVAESAEEKQERLNTKDKIIREITRFVKKL